jgi:hypothetical protein
MEKNNLKGWLELSLLEILAEFKGGDDEPLDGDGVERVSEIIKAKLNLFEGNITQEEYDAILDSSEDREKDDIRVVKINTTAFKEEDFYLLTDLSDEEIEVIITPIVEAEREDDEEYEYDNDSLVGALVMNFPNKTIKHYTSDSMDEIRI